MGHERLCATKLTKRYFRRGRASAYYFDAVANVSLSLAPGELVVLAGRSGCGKSTLLALLGGLLAPTSGTVALNGCDLSTLNDRALSRLRATQIGIIAQGQTPLHALTVLENVMLPLGLQGGDVAPSAHRALELLERLGVAELAGAYPSELSGGELRRVALARGLVANPSVVLADEPTSNLDDKSTACVLDLLRAAASAGSAVLLATHEPGADAYADRVLRMDAGRLAT